MISDSEMSSRSAESREASAAPDDDEAAAAGTVVAGTDPAQSAHRFTFPVVGIGASAGGLEALEALTRRLSSDGMAYIIIQHLAPGHESMMRDILARGTSLRVLTVHDAVEVERNTIYVTPPGTDLSIEQGHLHLKRASDRVPRHSIDVFFRTLAADAGPMAIGVILSGAGTDGTLGLRAIKDAGGITFAQEPSTASQTSMPQSAIDADSADFCLNPGEIGDELMRLAAHPFVARRPAPQPLSQEPLQRLVAELRRTFSVDFSTYKPATLERRIQRRMALRKIEKLDEYLKFVESSADELSILYGDLLIGVTEFFRDHEPFEVLKTVVFPRLLANRSPGSAIRIWCPGCASGEEAYSIAICLLEFLGPRANEFKVQIFGTDIDDEALARARHAQYPQNIEMDVSPERLRRFFTHSDSHYQVSRQIRDMVVFARHNLSKDPPFSRLDLVSCRNLLIYMQPALQRKVLRVFHYSLNPDGFLLLSPSESVGDASHLFSLLDRKLKIYLKKHSPSTTVYDFAFGKASESGEPRAPHEALPSSKERRPPVSVQQLADRKVIEKFGPPGVLLDEHMDVIQFRGQTGRFLAPSPGSATLNLLKLVRPEFLLELRSTLQEVSNNNVPHSSKPVRLHGEEEGRAVVLDIMPLYEADSQRKSFLVLFRDASDAHEPATPAVEEEYSEPRVQELERELLVTKEYLQTTVQDLEVANEEMQSANEELQSANEELQSTNEELETSKEELQSTNEELNTVNEELQNRMAQLSRASDDLHNIMSNLTVPFIIVGMDLRIRGFSAQAEKLLNLIAGDVGRPIAHLKTMLDAPHFDTLVSEAISTSQERTMRVRCPDSYWYAARIAQYRTTDHAIQGAIIEFVRASSGRRIGEPAETYEFIGKVLATLPANIMLLDDRLRILWVTDAFNDTFKLGDVVGRALDDVWGGRSEYPELFNAIEAAARGAAFREIRVEQPFGQSFRPMIFSARTLAREGDRPALTLVTMEESEREPS